MKVKTPSDLHYAWGDFISYDGEVLTGSNGRIADLDTLDPEDADFDALAELLMPYGIYLY